MQARERGQQRRVNVEMPVPPVPNEALGVETHEAGVAEQLDPCLFQHLAQRRIERFAGSEILVIDGAGRNGGGIGMRKTLGARYVRHHEHDLGGKVLSLAGLDQRPQIAAATGDEDGDARFRHNALRANAPA